MTKPLNPLSVELSDQLRDHLRRLLVRVDELRAQTQQPGAWLPPLDVYEAEDAVLVRVELPGVAPAQMRVSFRDAILKIEGRKEPDNLPTEDAPEAERPSSFLCLEREYGAFALAVPIQWQVEVERIAAHLSAGLLSIRLPKVVGSGAEIVIPITEEER
jgi:HSP20 family protein